MLDHLLGRGMSEQCEIIFQQTLTWPQTISMMMHIFHLKRAPPTASFILFAIFSGEEEHAKTLITVKF